MTIAPEYSIIIQITQILFFIWKETKQDGHDVINMLPPHVIRPNRIEPSATVYAVPAVEFGFILKSNHFELIFGIFVLHNRFDKEFFLLVTSLPVSTN